MTQFWFLLSATFFFLELSNPGLFYFLALSGSAAFLSILNFYEFFTNNVAMQCLLFFAISALLLTILYFYNRRLKSIQPYQSNMHQLIGQKIDIIEVTSPITGFGKINNQTWAITLHNQPKHSEQSKTSSLVVGQQALVTGIQGCHLQVIQSDQK